MNIITAVGNEEINNKLKNKKGMKIIGKDIQYQEAVIDVLETNTEIELLILSSILPGELNIKEFINIIKYKKPNMEIIIFLEKEDEELKKFIISKGINNIYYNNKITFEEVIKIIEEIENKNIINNKINKLEEIILEKNNKKYLNKIKIKIKYLINKIKNKIKHKKINNKIITIIGARKTGKTIFSLIFSLNIKNKKILLIDFNSESNNMKTIIGEKIKNNIINWKNNIDILFLKIQKDNDKTSGFDKMINKYVENYDYIIIDLKDIYQKGYVLKKSQKIILLVEANLLGIKETKQILEEVIHKQKNQKDNIKIVYIKHENTAIYNPILRKMFSDFDNVGKIKYDKNYNIFINTNGKILSKSIRNEYSKIIKKIL